MEDVANGRELEESWCRRVSGTRKAIVGDSQFLVLMAPAQPGKSTVETQRRLTKTHEMAMGSPLHAETPFDR